MKKVVGMLGDGAWATAMALVLVENGHRVIMWSPDAAHAEQLAKTRLNERYLPGVILPPLIEPTGELIKAITNVDLIFEAIPVKYLRSVVEKCRQLVDTTVPWVVLSKGAEPKTGALPTDLINNVFNLNIAQAVIMGPSFAKDLVTHDRTGVILATSSEDFSWQLQEMLTTDYFKLYFSDDLIGVQWCGVLKNIVALAIGIAHGAGCSDNTKAFLLTQGLHEIAQIVRVQGGDIQTVYGLAGIGDLVLTSYGKSGRNLEVGKMLGQGQSQEEIVQKTGYTPESFNTIYLLPKLISNDIKTFPLFHGIWNVVVHQRPVSEWLKEIFS